MSLTAALLIISSAFMHASWNYVSKRRDPTLAFFFVAAASAAFLLSPLLVMYRALLPHIPLSVWGLILATGVAQAVYFSGLAGAYRHGDMSLAYPLARALPVLAVAAISILLGKGGEIGHIGLVGMLLISLGCVVLPLTRFRGLRARDYTGFVYLMAIVAAAGTTAYTLIDDAALRRMRATSELALNNTQITLLFIVLQVISTSVVIGLVSLTLATERQRLTALLSNRQTLFAGMLTGIVIMATYGLVLASMAHVRNVSYVSAFRQLSIPIGALFGLILANETRHRPKIVGIIVISIGLVLVGVG